MKYNDMTIFICSRLILQWGDSISLLYETATYTAYITYHTLHLQSISAGDSIPSSRKRCPFHSLRRPNWQWQPHTHTLYNNASRLLTYAQVMCRQMKLRPGLLSPGLCLLYSNIPSTQLIYQHSWRTSVSWHAPWWWWQLGHVFIN